MNTSSKIFFAIFFLSIAVSFGLTYQRMVLEKNFPVFTDPETVPAPVDSFTQLFEYFQ